MHGSDFDWPELVPRAHLNIGIGHTVRFLKRDPFGDELTFSYACENAGTCGFIHTQLDEPTEQSRVMKNFGSSSLRHRAAVPGFKAGLRLFWRLPCDEQACKFRRRDSSY